MLVRSSSVWLQGRASRIEYFVLNPSFQKCFDELFSNHFLLNVFQLRPFKLNQLPVRTLSLSKELPQNHDLSKTLSKSYCKTPQELPFQVAPTAKSKRARNSNMTNNKLLLQYIKLTKPNLTVLVTLSSICSYAISPNTASISELALLTLGTALCSGSANAINMGREPEFDRRMIRTSSRPVVKGIISPQQAFKFAAVTGSIGSAILYFGVNPIVAALGFSNIVLYGWCYTSLKRISILNTWVGAIVGAIPPLMGWAASSSLLHPGAWCLASLLYAWQFPHFNALSHNIASQYKQAGYIMTAAENPRLNARVALRYSLLMFPICFGLSYFGVTDWVFSLDSSIANAWLTILAFRFWKQQNINHKLHAQISTHAIEAANSAARKLFWCSVWQLPVVLVLAMLHKKGQWDRLLNLYIV